MKKRFGFIVAALLTASCAFAQTIEPSGDKGDKNILNHLDGSISLNHWRGCRFGNAYW